MWAMLDWIIVWRVHIVWKIVVVECKSKIGVKKIKKNGKSDIFLEYRFSKFAPLQNLIFPKSIWRRPFLAILTHFLSSPISAPSFSSLHVHTCSAIASCWLLLIKITFTDAQLHNCTFHGHPKLPTKRQSLIHDAHYPKYSYVSAQSQKRFTLDNKILRISPVSTEIHISQHIPFSSRVTAAVLFKQSSPSHRPSPNVNFYLTMKSFVSTRSKGHSTLNNAILCTIPVTAKIHISQHSSFSQPSLRSLNTTFLYQPSINDHSY